MKLKSTVVNAKKNHFYTPRTKENIFIHNKDKQRYTCIYKYKHRYKCIYKYTHRLMRLFFCNVRESVTPEAIPNKSTTAICACPLAVISPIFSLVPSRKQLYNTFLVAELVNKSFVYMHCPRLQRIRNIGDTYM